MTLFFISDIHGSEFYLKKVIEKYKIEKADYIIILGDNLNHGPRNPLPEGYNPMAVADILNTYSEKIIAVRGNCDSEVDELVLNFPFMSTYSSVLYNGRRLFLTHGHIYNNGNMPNLSAGDVFIYGHTHIPVTDKIDDIYSINPGSISMPKENTPNSYGVLKDNVFSIKDLDGHIYKEIKFE